MNSYKIFRETAAIPLLKLVEVSKVRSGCVKRVPLEALDTEHTRMKKSQKTDPLAQRNHRRSTSLTIDDGRRSKSVKFKQIIDRNKDHMWCYGGWFF